MSGIAAKQVRVLDAEISVVPAKKTVIRLYSTVFSRISYHISFAMMLGFVGGADFCA